MRTREGHLAQFIDVIDLLKTVYLERNDTLLLYLAVFGARMNTVHNNSISFLIKLSL